MEIFSIFLPRFLLLSPLFVFPLWQLFIFFRKKDFASSLGLLIQGFLFALFSFLTWSSVKSDGLGIFVVYPFSAVLGAGFGLHFGFKKPAKMDNFKKFAFLSAPFFTAGLIFCSEMIFFLP